MSGQLAHAGDEEPVHEANLLAPKDGDEPFHVAVEEIEETRLLAPLFQWDEAADGGAVDECYLNGHGAIGHFRGRIALGRRRLDAGHLLFRDEEELLLVEEEREERHVLVEHVDRFLRLGAYASTLGEEHVAVEPAAIREDDT